MTRLFKFHRYRIGMIVFDRTRHIRVDQRILRPDPRQNRLLPCAQCGALIERAQFGQRRVGGGVGLCKQGGGGVNLVLRRALCKAANCQIRQGGVAVAVKRTNNPV